MRLLAPKVHEVFAPEQPARLDEGSPRDFSLFTDGSYQLDLPALGIKFLVDRLRRERHELVGELAVWCDLCGSRTVNGVLSIADMNLSSQRARVDRAKFLASRAKTKDSELDWIGLVEELCQRVLHAERAGQPAMSLRELPRPTEESVLQAGGLSLLAHHPVMFFGDGGAAKSYLALYLAGELASRGHRVGLFDWELAADDHRDRLERLFGLDMPDVRYVRCERPLVYEADRLRRVVQDDHLDYAVYDSVAFACAGPPEDAAVAAEYFRAVRQIGVGSLHVAHVSKAEGADKKPFGCHSDDTEVCTARGWVRHADVTLEDQVLCFSLTGNCLSWDRPTAVHQYDWQGELHHFHGASFDFLVTPTHDMVIKKPTSRKRWGGHWRKQSAERVGSVTTNVKIPAGTPMRVGPWDADVDERSERFWRFVGWWVAEGSLDGNAPVLTQATGERADEMLEEMRRLRYDVHVWEGVAKGREKLEKPCRQMRLRRATELGRWLQYECGRGSVNKRLPMRSLTLPLRQRQALLRGLIDGDGNRRKTRATYATISPRLADDVQQLALTCGHTARVVKSPGGRLWHRPRYTVLIGNRQALIVEPARDHITREPYVGRVWCLTVPTGAYVTRRRGYAGISGNSVFWANSARATWYVKLSETVPDAHDVIIGLYPRKANLGPLSRPCGFRFEFDPLRTIVTRVNLADVPDLASTMSLGFRLRLFLRQGPRTVDEIRQEFADEPAASVRQAIHRGFKRGHLVRFPGAGDTEQIALRSDREDSG